MKKITTLVLALLLTCALYAQSPESMNYQAVVRDGTGSIIANQAVGLEISIRQTSASGTVVYQETFSPTSNTNGLVNLAIGTGTVVSGTFATIDWANGPYFVEVGLDPAGGTTYSVTGTSQLLSVPYALYAKSSGDSKWFDTTTPGGIAYNTGNVSIGANVTDPFSTLLLRETSTDNNYDLLRFQNLSAGAVTRMSAFNDTNTQLSLGINNSTSAFGPNEAFLWYFANFDMKFATNSTEQLRIKNTGRIEVKTSDVYIENVGSGVIMKSPDGNCWRMTVSNAGAPVFTAITCP